MAKEIRGGGVEEGAWELRKRRVGGFVVSVWVGEAFVENAGKRHRRMLSPEVLSRGVEADSLEVCRGLLGGKGLFTDFDIPLRPGAWMCCTGSRRFEERVCKRLSRGTSSHGLGNRSRGLYCGSPIYHPGAFDR